MEEVQHGPVVLEAQTLYEAPCVCGAVFQSGTARKAAVKLAQHIQDKGGQAGTQEDVQVG